jgi:hypothetical protein
MMKWWRAGESNPRPRRCERRALPTELAPHFLERWDTKSETEMILFFVTRNYNEDVGILLSLREILFRSQWFFSLVISVSTSPDLACCIPQGATVAYKGGGN